MPSLPHSEAPQIPNGFKAMLSGILPERAEAIIEALSLTPSTSVRMNRRKPTASFLDSQGVEWCEDGFYLDERPNFTLNPLMHAGAFYVQEAASMILQRIMMVAAKKPLSVLDLCAAPGGKTTAAINVLPDGSTIVANEFNRERANILNENVIKWGYPNVIVTNAPTEAFTSLRNLFDVIIADLPCSGEGMMRKEPVARTQWSPALIKNCAELQRKIVADAIPSLKPGGYLIYSTCTFNREENEENVEWICNNLDMSSIEIPVSPEWGISGAIGSSIHALRFIPDMTRSEGLFVALLRKNNSDSNPTSFKLQKIKNQYKNREVDKLLRAPEKYSYTIDNNVITAIPETLLPILSAIQSNKNIRILSKGIEIATIKRDLIPSHPLALSTELNPEAFPRVELSLEQAIAYLRRENLILSPEVPKGYVLATFGNLPIGFLKNLVNRANNLYPQFWRIRH